MAAPWGQQQVACPPSCATHEEAGSLEHHAKTSHAGWFLQRVQQSWALAWAMVPNRSSTTSLPLHLVLGVVGQGPAAVRRAVGSGLSHATAAAR